jgi:hypothetical protein
LAPAAVPAAAVIAIDLKNERSWDLARFLWNPNNVSEFGRNERKKYGWVKGSLNVEELFNRGRKHSIVSTTKVLKTRQKTIR